MVNGELIGALAMTEPAGGSDVQSLKTRALKEGNSYRLNGQKTFITNGQHANLVIVAAKTNPTEKSKGTSLVELTLIVLSFSIIQALHSWPFLVFSITTTPTLSFSS